MKYDDLLDTDFFEIYKCGNEKRIHILGYLYLGEDDGNGEYRHVDPRDFDVPLKEYLSENFDYDYCMECSRQYITDLTTEGAERYMEDYLSEHKPLKRKLTIRTPCGAYYNEPPITLYHNDWRVK